MLDPGALNDQGALNYPLAVRALCSFTCKTGDLDRRFTPAPNAQQGIAGHGIVAARRGAQYQTEVSLRGEYRGLRVRGRADGYDPCDKRLDECKTHRGALARMPDNQRALHWAQLKTYGALLCQREGLEQIDLALVYFDVDEQRETILQSRFAARELQRFFERCCERFLSWARQEAARTSARDAGLKRVASPHELHAPQRELAKAVYRAAMAHGCLLAQAPTGVGKTLGTLLPMLKAMANQAIDKIFYLVPKSTGRRFPLETLATLKQRMPGTPLRVLELIAREKACVYPHNSCHGEGCPLARGFYDRLAAAREAALSCELMDQSVVRELALRHAVCPYYLSQELCRWSDVIVGDYNYYFDHGALLHGLTLENQWRVAVLVDEAHNLTERARGMYSVSLHAHELAAAQRCAPPVIQPALRRAAATWMAVFDAQDSPYVAYESPPQALLRACSELVGSLSRYALEHAEAIPHELQQFDYLALRFCRLAECFDEHSLFDATIDNFTAAQPAAVNIRNVIPGAFLGKRFADAACSVLFSATLSGRDFHRDMLGLPADVAWIDVGSPFRSEQLTVRVIDRISTRYRDRAGSLRPICELIARQFRRERGNYLVFVSSFDYLDALFGAFAVRCPDIPAWPQRRSMSETDRARFIDRFAVDGDGLGFAVLGGGFAEGIDLPGTRLIGAFIATLGLPQVNAINEQMMQRMQTRFGAGYEYTYLYPGLQKVAQAAGRVIRSPADRGTVFLIDDRYAHSQVRSVLPKWWQVAA
jgi:DNA excision repair protein ERCC-2